MLKVLIAPVTPFQQNCSIVWCDETMEGTAVDPGGDFDMLKEAIAEQGIKVTKVLLTHGHVDHASAAGTMADHYGVKIEGPHKDDLFLIEGLPDSGLKYNFPVYKPFVPDRWLDVPGFTGPEQVRDAYVAERLARRDAHDAWLAPLRDAVAQRPARIRSASGPHPVRQIWRQPT